MILVTALFVMPFWYVSRGRDVLARPFAYAIARTASLVINCLGGRVDVCGDRIVSDTFPMTVSPECLALEPTALFIACVLCFPCGGGKKAWGLLFGLPVLHVFNVLRIAALYFFGAWAPAFWTIAHIHVSQAILVLLVTVMWLIWLNGITACSARLSIPQPDK